MRHCTIDADSRIVSLVNYPASKAGCLAQASFANLVSTSRVSEFAPPSLQKPLSYVVGWCCCLGWIAGVPSCCVQLAGMVQTMILLMHPEADVSRLYQATLLLYCFLVLCVGFNIFCAQQLPLAEGILLFVHVLGFFVSKFPSHSLPF